MTRLAFNLNCTVYVRLTEHGRQILRDAGAALRQRQPSIKTPYVEPVADERGYTAFQGWQLMATFGDHLSLGLLEPFYLTVEFEADSLMPVAPA